MQLILIFFLILSLFLFGCKTKNEEFAEKAKTTTKTNDGKMPAPTQETNNAIAANPTKIASIEIKDKIFLKDSKGLPVAVKMVSDVKFQGNENGEATYSCKLAYANELIENGIGHETKTIERQQSATMITLLNPVEGKLDISR